jgi:AraC family transcriptional regulator
LPEELTRLRLAQQAYAVFKHDKHVSEIEATCRATWGEWLPGSGYEPVDAPFLERYSESFDPETGNGGLEVWLPIVPGSAR